MTDLTKFWSRVDTSGECWLWTGSVHRSGYGRVSFQGKTHNAHRLAYEDAHGTIPDGLMIDHKCRNRACVRPDHLQAVTNAENSQNRAGAQANSKSGVRGVYFHQGKWRAQIRAGGKNHSGGVFTSLEEATAAASRLRASLMTNSLADR